MASIFERMMKVLVILLCAELSALTAFAENSLSSQISQIKAEDRDVCGGLEQIVLTDIQDHGFISSPGYPSNYPNSVVPRDCGQDLLVDSGTIDTVRLGFLHLRTMNEDYVQLELRDTNPNLEWFEQFTGTYDLFVPPLFAANEATVFLQSDATGADIGYLAAYASELPNNGKEAQMEVEDKNGPGIYELSSVEVININTATGEITTTGDVNQLHTKVQPIASETYGFLSSPNHPNNYPNAQRIVYNLSGPVGSRFALRVLRAEFEPQYDYLTIYNNGTPIDEIRSLRNDVIYSPGNEVMLIFRSDNTITFRGFLIAYATIQA